MSGSLLALGVGGAVANELISVFLRPRRSIGMIVPNVTVSERHTDTLEITRHPVEKSAVVSDHAYMQPFEVVIHAGWSNSSYEAVGSLLSGGDILGALSDGVFGDSYVQQIYAKLQKLQQSREPFDIVTGKRKYSDMLIASMVVTTDNTSEYSLMAQITCKQVIIVSTQTTTLPPIKDQGRPDVTASPLDTGTNQPAPVTNPNASMLNRLHTLGQSIF